MTQIQSVISRVFDSVSRPGLSNGFHVCELRGEADLGGFALSESSWQRREDSWKPEQHGVTPNSSLTQKHKGALDELPLGSTSIRYRVSPARKWVTFYSPIHPSTDESHLHLAAQDRGLKRCCNFNLSTPLFNKGAAALQTQAPSCSLHPVCLKSLWDFQPFPVAVQTWLLYWLSVTVFLIERVNCDVHPELSSRDSAGDCDGNDYRSWFNKIWTPGRLGFQQRCMHMCMIHKHSHACSSVIFCLAKI